MIRRAGVSLAVLATIGLAGCLGPRPAGLEVRHYKTDPSLSFKPVTIQELTANPSQIGLHVQFPGIFNKMDEPFWQAFYTGFKQEDCKSFSAWPPEAAVWDPNGRGSAIGTLFIRNDSYFLAAFSKTAQYTPICIKGVVRNDFERRPWIEVVDVDILGAPAFSKEGLASLYVGLSEVRDKPAAAQQNLTRALNGTLSAAGRAAAWNGMAWIAHSARNYAQAEEHYSNALKAHPENDDAKEGIWRARNKMEPKAVMLPRSTSTPPTPSTTEGSTKELEKAIAERDELKTQLETLKNGAKEALLAEADKSKRATEQAKALGAELEEVRKKLADAGAGGARVAELEAKIKSLETDMGAAWEKVKAADAEIADLKKKIADAGGDVAKITELEGKVKAADAEIADLKKKIADAGGDAAKITELESKVKTAEAAATAAAEKAKATEAERDELKKRLENAGGDAAKVTELEGKLKTAEAAATAAAEKAKATEAERDELKKRLENAGGDAAKVTELEGKLKTAETERDDLKKKLAEAGTGGDTEALKKQIADKDTEIKALTDKIAAVEKDAMAAAEAKLKAENEARIAEFEQKVKDRDETIKKLREEIDRLAEELKKKGG